MNSLLRRTKFPQYVSSQTKLPLNHINETRNIFYDRLDSWKHNQPYYNSLGEFTIASFNMLAPVYKRMSALDLHTGGRRRESQYEELWKSRATKTKRFFEEEFLSSVDVIALQEFWLNVKYLNFFREEFYKHGYQLFMLQRTGTKLDAVAFVVKNKTFLMKKLENVYLCNMRDRVALMMWLQHRETGKDIIIANTHLSFPHNNLESLSQVHQMEIITKVMDNFAHRCEVEHAMRLVVGDFNAEMNSRVCDHLRKAGFTSCFEISPLSNPAALSDSHPKAIKASNHSPSAAHTPTESTSIEIPTLFTPHSYRSQHSDFTSFVSHRNHLKEDVGVDHLFIRPERDPVSNQPTNLVDWTMSASILSEEESEAAETENNEEKPEDSMERNGKGVLLDPSLDEKVFIDNCTVLPRQKSCQAWDETFRISDHRPVLAKIIFGRRK